MPGIVGIFNSSAQLNAASALTAMLGSMMHEPFYSSASYVNDRLGVALGLVANRDGASFVWSSDRNLGCFLSGEVSIDAPSSNGFHSNGEQGCNTAARHLLSRYEHDGADAALLHLNGWFSGAIVDVRQQKVLLFNDRYGLGRVYVHQNGSLFFASEAKALLTALPRLRSLDSQSVTESLACGCALEDRTLFQGISLLPPGSVWSVDGNGSVTKSRYFHPKSWEQQETLAPSDFEDRLADVFPRALQRSLQGQTSLAMSLTGGLDGRMIMAWARPSAGKLPCYTFNGPYRDCADVRIGRRVARACEQSHQTIAIDEQFLAGFPALAERSVRISDGTMDVTGAAEIYANRLAREIAPVRLTGNYGSEILRRYVAFRPRALPAGLFAPSLSDRTQNVRETYAAAAQCHPLSFIAFKQVPWHHYARFSVEQSQIAVRSPFLDNELVQLAFQAPNGTASHVEPTLRVIARGDAGLMRIPTDRGLTYPALGFTNRFRRSANEFLAKAEYAYDYGMPDWLARADRCASPLRLERLFLGRQKFCHFRTWYRRQLAPYVKEVLLDPASLSRPYLNRAAIEPLVMGHIRGTHNRTLEIHKLLSLELLHRTLLA